MLVLKTDLVLGVGVAGNDTDMSAFCFAFSLFKEASQSADAGIGAEALCSS